MNNPIHIAKIHHPSTSGRVILACSGGMDSVVLFHLLLAEEINFEVAHVNYHLRSDESDGDEYFVRSLCKKNGIPFHLHSLFLGEILEERKGNLQAIAREERYSFFQKLLADHPENVLYTAHHSDDQVETFFLRLGRKSGLKGLTCMRAVRGKIHRPLLGYSQEILRQYARENSLTWREDSSNNNTKYLRNKWRKEWLPLIESKDLSIRQSVLSLIKAFQQTYDRHVTKLSPLSIEIKQNQFLSFETFDSLTIDEQYILGDLLSWSTKDTDAILKLRSAETSSKHCLFNSPTKIFKMPEGFSWKDRSIEINLLVEKVNQLPSIFQKNILYLDGEKIKGELVARPWRIGDRIASIGMKGTQLVSDIIKDAKIHGGEKEKVLIVADDQEIHWVANLKVGRRAIAYPQSKTILKISFTPTTNH